MKSSYQTADAGTNNGMDGDVRFTKRTENARMSHSSKSACPEDKADSTASDAL